MGWEPSGDFDGTPLGAGHDPHYFPAERGVAPFDRGDHGNEGNHQTGSDLPRKSALDERSSNKRNSTDDERE